MVWLWCALETGRHRYLRNRRVLRDPAGCLSVVEATPVQAKIQGCRANPANQPSRAGNNVKLAGDSNPPVAVPFLDHPVAPTLCKGVSISRRPFAGPVIFDPYPMPFTALVQVSASEKSYEERHEMHFDCL